MIRLRFRPKHSHKVAVYLKLITLSFKSDVTEKHTRKLLVTLLTGFVHWPNIFESVWIAKIHKYSAVLIIFDIRRNT